jgi:guanylate kinase
MGAVETPAVEGAPGALLVIISGPSGVGKDTIIDAMQRRRPRADRRYVITCTTRERRVGEVDGVHYHFCTPERFYRLRDEGGLLEWAQVHGNWYGTPRDQVVEALIAGQDAILKIDVQGAHAVRASIPEALLIFVVPPSLDALTERLVSRSTETREQLERRLGNAAAELARQGDYDHVVVNETGQVDRTAAAIDEIIKAEHARFPGRRLRV